MPPNEYITLQTAITYIDKSENNTAYIEPSDLLEALGLNLYVDYEKWDAGIKGYYLHKWLCTDTWVGVTVIFLGDEFLCICRQTARKNPKEYTFASAEMKAKLFQWACTLVEGQNESYLPSAQFIPLWNSHNYPGQVLATALRYVSDECDTMVTRISQGHTHPEMVMCALSDGARKILPVYDLYARLCVGDVPAELIVQHEEGSNEP